MRAQSFAYDFVDFYGQFFDGKFMIICMRVCVCAAARATARLFKLHNLWAGSLIIASNFLIASKRAIALVAPTHSPIIYYHRQSSKQQQLIKTKEILSERFICEDDLKECTAQRHRQRGEEAKNARKNLECHLLQCDCTQVHTFAVAQIRSVVDWTLWAISVCSRYIGRKCH